MEPLKRSFKMYLAPWQTRIVRDFLELRKLPKTVTIKPGLGPCPNSYKIPAEGISRRDWLLYLTDEQMIIVKEQFKLPTPISSINITERLLKNKDVVFK
jgi:hypothetical protein